MPVSKEQILQALSKVKDPELGKDIVSLGFVREVSILGKEVYIRLVLTTPACPARDQLLSEANARVAAIPGVDKVRIDLPAEVSSASPVGKSGTSQIKNVIAVASGKGGVGKSTVAVNLAVALAKTGAKVGILDADIYGASIPAMLGASGLPDVHDNRITPLVAQGVEVVSMGFFSNTQTPVIWRGPLIGKAVKDFLELVEWSPLDYLIVDLPPGCMPAGTMVLAANSAPVPIEEVKVGDFVLSYDGSQLVPRRVVGVLPQGMQEVFELRTPNRKVIASANHPFMRYHWSNKYAWRRLDQLKAGDRILATNCIEGGRPMTLPAPDQSSKASLPKETTPKFMQILGHFVGDGFIKRTKRKSLAELRICEPKGSKYRLKYESLYREVLGCRTFDDNDGQKFAVSSVPVSSLFKALDLDHRAREKCIPDWIFSLPLDQRLAFIRGYAEADGTIRHRELTRQLPDAKGVTRMVVLTQDMVGVASTNERLVRQLRQLCMISGLRVSNFRQRQKRGNVLRTGRKIPGVTQFEFDFSLKTDARPFKLTRIKSISPLGMRPTYDLQVEDCENFVADGVIVHNTGDAALSLAQSIRITGVVVVTTPQEAALQVAGKALYMFRKLDIPILGIIENMSYFVCPHCGERAEIFSHGGGKSAAEEAGVPFLGEIPLDTQVRVAGDVGIPLSTKESPVAESFAEVARTLAGQISILNYTKKEQHTQ